MSIDPRQLGYRRPPADMQERILSAEAEARLAEETKREDFSRQFERFCSILSGTGIGRMVDR